jgi:plasmid stabilization system protein ParE
MGCRAEVTDLAREDIDEAIDYIAADSKVAASNWHSRLETLMLSLGEMPGRFAVIPEAADLKTTH